MSKRITCFELAFQKLSLIRFFRAFLGPWIVFFYLCWWHLFLFVVGTLIA